MKVSLDGGETYVPAPEGVRIIYDLPQEAFEAGDGHACELHINATTEGVIQDLVTVDGDVVGTSATLLIDLATDLRDE